MVKLGALKKGSAAVAAKLSAARSERNRATRTANIAASEERASARRYKRARAREDRERAMKKGVRVTVAEHERPRTRGRTPRALFYRLGGRAIGGQLLKASIGSGTRSVHFRFTARGFGSRTGRRWRSGEGERAAQYITREEALEGGEAGWWSTIAADRNELVAFHRASEALEKHDRANANVYVTEIVALPASLTARQRRRAVRRYCRYFDKRGLPYTVAMHKPDPQGDVRNYHVHIVYSLRPAQRLGPYDWNFAVSKVSDVNTPEGIAMRRKLVVDAINATLRASGSGQRFTHLSNHARGLGLPGPKIGQQQNWIARRLADAEDGYARLGRLKAMMDRLGEGVRTISRAHGAEDVARSRLLDRKKAVQKGVREHDERVAFCRARLIIWLNDQRVRERMRRYVDAVAKAKAAVQVDLAAISDRITASRRSILDVDTHLRAGTIRRLLDLRTHVVAGVAAITRIDRLHGKVEGHLGQTRARLQAPLPPLAPPESLPRGSASITEAVTARPKTDLADVIRQHEAEALSRTHAQIFVKLAAMGAKPSRDENGRWTIDLAGLSSPERRAVDHPDLAEQTQRKLQAMAAIAVVTTTPPEPDIDQALAKAPFAVSPSLTPSAARRQVPTLGKGPDDIRIDPPTKKRGPER
ncbi:MobA/MobL family protein [Sphingomonas adhaesiva]|uniref:MobA/MobL family protein n=1 Tax=Sphingomonas adhaesiva TaxID=28212 RepID=UPI002FF7E2B2